METSAPAYDDVDNEERRSSESDYQLDSEREYGRGRRRWADHEDVDSRREDQKGGDGDDKFRDHQGYKGDGEEHRDGDENYEDGKLAHRENRSGGFRHARNDEEARSFRRDDFEENHTVDTRNDRNYDMDEDERSYRQNDQDNQRGRPHSSLADQRDNSFHDGEAYRRPYGDRGSDRRYDNRGYIKKDSPRRRFYDRREDSDYRRENYERRNHGHRDRMDYRRADDNRANYRSYDRQYDGQRDYRNNRTFGNLQGNDRRPYARDTHYSGDRFGGRHGSRGGGHRQHQSWRGGGRDHYPRQSETQYWRDKDRSRRFRPNADDDDRYSTLESDRLERREFFRQRDRDYQNSHEHDDVWTHDQFQESEPAQAQGQQPKSERKGALASLLLQ